MQDKLLFENPTLLLSSSFDSLIRDFSFSDDKRQLLTGRKVFSSDHPRVKNLNPLMYFFFAWLYTFVNSSTFLEQLRSKIVSSMIRTFTRFSSVSFVMVEFTILAESREVNFNQFMDVEFKNL